MSGRFNEARLGMDGKVALICIESYLEFLGIVSWRMFSINFLFEFPSTTSLSLTIVIGSDMQ